MPTNAAHDRVERRRKSGGGLIGEAEGQAINHRGPAMARGHSFFVRGVAVESAYLKIF